MSANEAAATAYVDSEALARCAFNALAFLPAKSMVKAARILVGPAGLVACGTDGYAAGEDRTELERYEGPAEGVRLLVDRAALTALDKGGRADKRGTGRIEARPNDGLVFRPADNAPPVGALDVSASSDSSVWDVVDGLFERYERAEPALPEFLAFTPDLLSRFGKVKAPRVIRHGRSLDTALDMCVYDAKSPILIKIGPYFRGLIMPIDRDVYEENIGPEGLW